jgi:SPP1 family predicted phage head-tail adaptor
VTAPGELRHRLVLEAPVEAPDGAGGVARSYVALATLWAKVTPASARGDVIAAGTGATVTHHIVIRRRSGVTTRHRLRDGVRVFRIAFVRDEDGGRRFIEIQAEERTA